jgi:hypothetical protein
MDDRGVELPDERFLRWDRVSAVVEHPEHHDDTPRTIAFLEPRLPGLEERLFAQLAQRSDAVRRTLRLVLRCLPGRLAEGVVQSLDALTTDERSAIADACIEALRSDDLEIPNLLLAVGLTGEPRHLLALGDFLVEPTDVEDSQGLCHGPVGGIPWRWAFALGALRLAATRDAYMQIQRACYEAAHAQVVDHAREVLLRVAGDKKVPVWTVEDQLVPTCGLDPDADATVSWDGHHLQMRLDDELTPFLVDTTGRRFTALPDGDEPSGRARMRWDVVREQVAEAVPVQVHRLEEALVQQYRWEAAHWARHVLGHPLLCHLVQRVVWGAYTRGGRRLTSTFRVARDRTLWGPDDEPWDRLDAIDGIGLVHPLELDDETRQAWSAILADYEVVTLFPQIDRPTYEPPDDLRRSPNLALDVETPSSTLLRLHHRGWRNQNDWRAVLTKVFRGRNVKARIDLEVSEKTVRYASVGFHRYLGYPKTRFELRDVADVPYSETVYELETLRMPQETGGWPAVTRG